MKQNRPSGFYPQTELLDSVCSVVWGSCGKTFSNKIQKPQNRAARVLTFSNYEADAPQFLKKKLNWDNLETRC